MLLVWKLLAGCIRFEQILIEINDFKSPMKIDVNSGLHLGRACKMSPCNVYLELLHSYHSQRFTVNDV